MTKTNLANYLSSSFTKTKEINLCGFKCDVFENGCVSFGDSPADIYEYNNNVYEYNNKSDSDSIDHEDFNLYFTNYCEFVRNGDDVMYIFTLENEDSYINILLIENDIFVDCGYDDDDHMILKHINSNLNLDAYPKVAVKLNISITANKLIIK